MIEQLQFSLRTAETPRLPSAWAYRIYGWLMAQLPADTAARLHEQGEHPLSQSLCFDAAAQTSAGKAVFQCSTRLCSSRNSCG